MFLRHLLRLVLLVCIAPSMLLASATQQQTQELMAALMAVSHRAREKERCHGTLYHGAQRCHRMVRRGVGYCSYHRMRLRTALPTLLRQGETDRLRDHRFASDVMQSVAEQAAETGERESLRRNAALDAGEQHAQTFHAANNVIAEPDRSVTGTAKFVEQLCGDINTNVDVAPVGAAVVAAPAASAAAPENADAAAAAAAAPPTPPPLPGRRLRRNKVIDIDDDMSDDEMNDDDV